MTRWLAVFAVLLALPANSQDAPDTSKWECRFCPIPGGLYFDFDVGAGYVSEDAYRFGNYRGFDGDGAIFLGDLDLRYWSRGGSYWELVGRDLGLEARELAFQWNSPDVRFSLMLDQLPHQLYGQSVTPFAGIDTLSLPAGWVSGGSTAAMTGLADSSNPVRIGHERESVRFDLLVLDPSDWLRYEINYRRAKRDGRGIHGGSFISQSTLLPEPIDYATDEIDVAVIYTGDRANARIAYYASMFDSQPLALTWDNPFNALAAGASQGRAAMPPDSEAHQLSLSGAVRLTPTTRLSGLLAVGRLEQNETFLPYTINATLAGALLPASSLGGEVDTRRFNLRLNTRPNRRLRLRADINVDDRDNSTPRNDYAVVESDLFAAGIRRNVPYSFKRSRARLRGNYKLNRELTLSSGYRYREIERDFQEVQSTEEHGGWFGATLRQTEKISAMSVKFGQDERKGSDYLLPGDPVTAQNPLLRKYNLADRDRQFVQASISAAPSERVDVGFSFESAEEDYNRSVIGLLTSDSQRVNIDGAWQLGEAASLSLYYGRELIESQQAGSAGFASRDWVATVEDEIDTVSIALRWPQLREKIDFGLEYLYSNATGRIALSRTAAPLDNFPDLDVSLRSARLFADIRPNDRYSMRIAYYHERLTTDDWMLDGLAPDTLQSLLALGAESPQYSGGIFSLSFRYSLAPRAANE
ncbi:MAG: MtrB/PioB family decaheme-associated outer membrane protein [Gammaproteobacteria bacterium]|nr:MtrB/PioB family decaheme-associated outer membrane protein [Gammaproteobacteria bacterium]